ncbi:MAG: hypothetical protein NC253_07120 [Ruminococcus sp.]|nr:hypothetical protein [Ruminococcus sp.]MCM1480616.1 hypothetical protein [Muribaculaceae bacterium]
MNTEFKKYEIISFIFFINACTWPFLVNTKITILGVIFDETYLVNFIITIVCLIFFTVKAIWSLSFSKIKKTLFIFVQLICCLIIYAIWLIIWLFMFSGGISFGE